MALQSLQDAILSATKVIAAGVLDQLGGNFCLLLLDIVLRHAIAKGVAGDLQ